MMNTGDEHEVDYVDSECQMKNKLPLFLDVSCSASALTVAVQCTALHAAQSIGGGDDLSAAQWRLNSHAAGCVSDCIITLVNRMHGQLKRFGCSTTTMGHILALVASFTRFSPVQN